MKRNRKIVVLGSEGMLGQMAVLYFTRKGYAVIAGNQRFENDTREEFMRSAVSDPGTVIINCIGKIRQKTSDPAMLLWSNAVFPLALHHALGPGHTLVHPSTDCVFMGTKGKPYSMNDRPDATDDYGWSKRLGELALMGRHNTLIVRTSIVGKDTRRNPCGLLGWFLNNAPDARLNGYANHLWNGITTLEWCKQVEALLDDPGLQHTCRLVHIGTREHYSKYQMLLLFQETFHTNYRINPYATAEAVDRRLVPDIVARPLDVQLKELLDYYNGT